MLRLIPLLFLFILNGGWAADNDLDTLKQQQRQLEEMLSALKNSEQQYQQQKAAVKKLTRQLECNWTLIQSYETCQALYKDDLQALIDCTSKAKQNATRCLGGEE
jgi:hypothetical protein